MDASQRVLAAMKQIQDEKLVPCLAAVTQGEDGELVGFEYFRLAMAKGEPDTGNCFGGVVQVFDHSKGTRILVAIPSIFDMENTSGREDNRAFVDSLHVAGNGISAKFMLFRSELYVGLDLVLPQACDDLLLLLTVHEGVRRTIKSHYDWILRRWASQALEVIGKKATLEGMATRAELILSLLGSDPLGEPISDEPG